MGSDRIGSIYEGGSRCGEKPWRGAKGDRLKMREDKTLCKETRRGPKETSGGLKEPQRSLRAAEAQAAKAA